MGTIIEFPGNDERREKEYFDLLDKGLNFTNKNLQKCVRDNVASVLTNYHPSKLPSHTFSLDLPPGISSADTEMIVSKIQDEVQKYVSKIRKPILTELVLLHLELCKYKIEMSPDHGNADS